jgi:hypothetical protein
MLLNTKKSMPDVDVLGPIPSFAVRTTVLMLVARSSMLRNLLFCLMPVSDRREGRLVLFGRFVDGELVGANGLPALVDDDELGLRCRG